ncbi:hypothetical protein KSF73_09740 [Burkholderiaceae bacterium DAT-1]|nr:hypothetical protein [Burkholderiaceae bacterium DAT-1]
MFAIAMMAAGKIVAGILLLVVIGIFPTVLRVWVLLKRREITQEMARLNALHTAATPPAEPPAD